jgi:hypothetical protein
VGADAFVSDAYLFIDTDVYLLKESVENSLELLQTFEVVKPYTAIHDLTPEQTTQLLTSTPLTGDPHPRGQICLMGGAAFMTHAAYLKVGKWDENLEGWGCEDNVQTHKVEAFGLSCVQLHDEAYHLWHERKIWTDRDKEQYKRNLDYANRIVQLPLPQLKAMTKMKVFTRHLPQNQQLFEWCRSLTEPFEHIGLMGTTAQSYLEFLLGIKDRDWAINLDEDAFLFSVDRLIELQEYMEEQNFVYCGVRDGGETPMRFHNPSVTNPFFNIFNLGQIRKVPPDGTLRPDCCIELEPARFPQPYSFDMFEPFYPHFLWLRKNFKCLFLNTKVHTDNTSTVVYDHLERPLLIHTWFAREFTPQNLRFQQAYDFARASSSSECPR